MISHRGVDRPHFSLSDPNFETMMAAIPDRTDTRVFSNQFFLSLKHEKNATSTANKGEPQGGVLVNLRCGATHSLDETLAFLGHL